MDEVDPAGRDCERKEEMKIKTAFPEMSIREERQLKGGSFLIKKATKKKRKKANPAAQLFYKKKV